jgi:hypothetical protein
MVVMAVVVPVLMFVASTMMGVVFLRRIRVSAQSASAFFAHS